MGELAARARTPWIQIGLEQAWRIANRLAVPRLIHHHGLLRKQGPLLALIAAISAVFVVQTVVGEPAYFDFMVVPGKIVHAWDAMRSGAFAAGSARDFGSLLSYAFLHADGAHLLFNMLYLWIFAALAAELLGHGWMLVIFGFTAICGGICHVALNAGEFVPMLGASGAVMGFEGLYLGMAARWQLPDPQVWPMSRSIPPSQLAALGGIGFLMDFTGLMDGSQGVAYGAHMGGFIGGMVLACTLVPKPRAARAR